MSSVSDSTAGDVVGHIVEQWRDARPDLDPSPIEVIGRISRLSRVIDRRLAAHFAEHDLQDWMYDVLATLRRQGPPFELTAGQLVAQAMVTTGAITNRVDRLEARGLVERRSGPDRRTVIVGLTDAGRTVVDRVTVSHLATEAELLTSLNAADHAELAATLRHLLLALGDVAEPVDRPA